MRSNTAKVFGSPVALLFDTAVPATLENRGVGLLRGVSWEATVITYLRPIRIIESKVID